MTVTNVELQSQITSLDKKVDERHVNNTRLLEEMGHKLDTLIQLNVDQKVQAQIITQLSTKARDQDTANSEIFRRLGSVESKVNAHAWAWKIVGAVALACLGGIGWMLAQMKEYYHYEDRVDTLEFLVQGRASPVLPPSQTTSGSK
ncbi:hypothetical protein [Burkholderia sp. 4M9327F10]|uniref:hypothetical protein n=1 Tax=Burkholderiaceae TaxID=119060 RepID=UPI0010F4BC57|nr:hypothetical protein [Burkholderia sp. 4M9327F10]